MASSMTPKIANMLLNDTLALNIRKVMAANYFADICDDEIVFDLILNNNLDADIKAELIKLYQGTLFISDSSIRTKIIPLLESIIQNDGKQDRKVIAAAMIALSAFNSHFMIDNLEKVISLIKTDKDAYYGSLAEYFVNMISSEPVLINQIAPKLYELMMTDTGNIINMPSKLLLDIIYKHYRKYNIYKDNNLFKKLTDDLRNCSDIKKFDEILKNFVDIIPCSAVCLFDINPKLKTYHYNLGFNDTYLYKEYPLSLDSEPVIKSAISNTSPLLLKRDEQNLNGFFKQFNTAFKNILVIPCLYFGEANSLLIILNNSNLNINLCISSFILAKYLAGAIYRFRKELELLLYYEDFAQNEYLIIKGLQHDIKKSSGMIKNSISAMQNEPGNSKENIKRAQSCEAACKIIEDALKSIVSFSDPNKEIKNVNEAVKTVIRVLYYPITQNKIEVNLMLDDECPEIMVVPGLTRVIFNLAINAINILSEIGIGKKKIIEVRTKYDTDLIKIIIKDNGPGMKEELQQNIFEPHTSTAGGGLGLFIAKHMIKEIGGNINFLSDANNGTEFTVEIPI